MTIRRFQAEQFDGRAVEQARGPSDLLSQAGDYRLMLGCVIEAILDRYDRRGDYPFIDTKFSLRSGEDFADDDPIRGTCVIYGWVQGRGLEALSGHAAWLKRCPAVAPDLRDRLVERIAVTLREVLDRMETLRAANGGRLFFAMTPEGRPLRMDAGGRYVEHRLDPDAPANTTELFYVKGMAAAAHALGDKERLAAACRWYERINQDIRADRLASDQQPLDPKNAAIGAVPGRRGHGARMLGLGAAALLADCTGDARWVRMGTVYLDDVLDRHVNVDGRDGRFKPGDMWEFIDPDNHPWVEDGGVVRCDPGHACEFVGLAMKLLAAADRLGARPAGRQFDRYLRALPEALERNFANGFAPSGVGIYKAVDLVSRRVIHPDIPWWSLPETMRAAAETLATVGPALAASMARIAADCSNAFLRHFVRPDLHLMAYQTLNDRGEPVDAIPGTPDADAGYHTGLSIIDYLDALADASDPTGA